MTCPKPTKQQLKYRTERKPLPRDDKLLCDMHNFFESEEDQVTFMSKQLIAKRRNYREIISNIHRQEQTIKNEENITCWFKHYDRKCSCYYCRKELRQRIEWESWI